MVDEKELWSRGLRSVSSLILLRWSVVQNASEIDGPTIGLIRAAGNQALCALPRSHNHQIVESWDHNSLLPKRMERSAPFVHG